MSSSIRYDTTPDRYIAYVHLPKNLELLLLCTALLQLVKKFACQVIVIGKIPQLILLRLGELGQSHRIFGHFITILFIKSNGTSIQIFHKLANFCNLSNSIKCEQLRKYGISSYAFSFYTFVQFPMKIKDFLSCSTISLTLMVFFLKVYLLSTNGI